MNEKDRRTKRMELANQYIKAISETGRRFFQHNGYTTNFVVCRRTRKLRIIDKYSKKWICIHRQGRWHGFTDGGTLKGVIEDLRDFIMGRRAMPQYTYKYWGYNPEDMKALDAALAPIIQAAKDVS